VEGFSPASLPSSCSFRPRPPAPPLPLSPPEPKPEPSPPPPGAAPRRVRFSDLFNVLHDIERGAQRPAHPRRLRLGLWEHPLCVLHDHHHQRVLCARAVALAPAPAPVADPDPDDERELQHLARLGSRWGRRRARRAGRSGRWRPPARHRRGQGQGRGRRPPPPPPSRTKWTRLVHPSLLIGHVSCRRRRVLAGACCALAGASQPLAGTRRRALAHPALLASPGAPRPATPTPLSAPQTRGTLHLAPTASCSSSKSC